MNPISKRVGLLSDRGENFLLNCYLKMNCLFPLPLLLLLSCSLAAEQSLLPKSEPQLAARPSTTNSQMDNSALEPPLEYDIKENDCEKMSFQTMEKIIQDLSTKLKHNNNELLVATNSSGNSSMNTCDMKRYSDRKLVAALTKVLVDLMTRTPVRLYGWLKCNKVAQSGLYRARDLASRAVWFLPLESEAFGKVGKIVGDLFNNYCELKNDNYSKSRMSTYAKIYEQNNNNNTSDLAKMIADSIGSVEYAIKAIHSIDFAEFSNDKLISYSQLLVDFSRFAGLHVDDVITRKTKIDMENIEQTYGSFSMRLMSVMKCVHLAPKNTNVDRLSKRFQSLKVAVEEYAALSPEKDTILEKIRNIGDRESRASTLCSSWKHLTNKNIFSKEDYFFRDYDWIIRGVEIKMAINDIDPDYIEEKYSLFSMELLKILKSVHLAPKGTNVKKLSKLFQSLSKVVEEFALLSPGLGTIMQKIQNIKDEENKFFRLCDSLNNHKMLKNPAFAENRE